MEFKDDLGVEAYSRSRKGKLEGEGKEKGKGRRTEKRGNKRRGEEYLYFRLCSAKCPWVPLVPT